MTSILIVSQVRFYREGLAESLAATGVVHIAAVASNWTEAIATVAASQPAVVLVEVGTGLDHAVIAELSQLAPLTKVVALALTDGEYEIIRWVEAGIHGYVSCNASVSDIVRAVDNAVNDRVECTPHLAAALFRHVSSVGRPSEEASRSQVRRLDVLTPREAETVASVARGMSNKAIAKRLGIALGTVKNHVHSALQKLDFQNRSQLTAWYHTGEQSVRHNGKSATATTQVLR